MDVRTRPDADRRRLRPTRPPTPDECATLWFTYLLAQPAYSGSAAGWMADEWLHEHGVKKATLAWHEAYDTLHAWMRRTGRIPAEPR